MSIRINPVSDTQIEFHNSHLGTVTTAHSPEAAAKILAGMGMTPESFLDSVTPRPVDAPSGFAGSLLPPPLVATLEHAQAIADKNAGMFGRSNVRDVVSHK